MADEPGKAWQRIVKSLAGRLPGDWVVGRPGAKAVLVRRPIEWTLTWVGLDRPRNTAEPFLIAGVVDLVRPFSFGYRHGLRSDYVDQPGTVPLLAEDAEQAVERFVIDQALPVVDSWPASRLAAEAEADFALPPDQRSRPFLYPVAAGWRVVEDSGSPVEPARQAAEEFGAAFAPDDAKWYRGLLEAWESGERPAALAYLETERQATLGSLKLPSDL